MATLLHYFSGLFTYGLALDQHVGGHGRPSQASGQIYGELRNRVEEAKLAALQAQKRAQDVDEAAFAVVAWLDEVIARHPELWEAATALQLTMFGTTNAGNEFFTHLRALSAQQDEVREVYYVAMCLGFVGQYYYEAGDTGELGRFKENHSRNLPAPPAALPALVDEKITAQPYRVADPAGIWIPGRWPEKVAKGVVLAALATVVGILAYYLLKDIRPPEVDPDPRVVAEHLRRYACHDFAVTQRDAGRVEVRGHVRTPADRERLSGELRALPGGAKIQLDVDPLQEPFCEVVGVIAPLRTANLEGGGNFKIATRSGNQHLIEGDLISFDAKLPPSPACLYVDYFVADGNTVVHLFPAPGDDRVCGLSHDTVPIGEPKPGRPPWLVTEPFGREMVVAIASAKPLFGLDQRGVIEAPRDYLRALRQALQANGQTGLADYMLVTTDKKQP